MDPSNEKGNILPEGICLIEVPSFGGRVLVPAVDSLKKVKGNHAKAVLIAVFGNRAYDDTILELKDIAEESGFECIAAIAVEAEHSIMHQIGSGRTEEQYKEELKNYVAQIFHRLSEGRSFGALSVSGKRPYREYKGLPFQPKAGKACNECGRCAGICPVGAIGKDNPRVTDNLKCITCMVCVAACPDNVRKLNPVLLKAASAKMKKICSTRKENLWIMGADS